MNVRGAAMPALAAALFAGALPGLGEAQDGGELFDPVAVQPPTNHLNMQAESDGGACGRAEDGRYVALVAPWIARGDPSTTERATISGPAVFLRTDRGSSVLLCGERETGFSQARLWVRDAVGREARWEARRQAGRRAAGEHGEDSVTPVSLVGTYPLVSNQVMAHLSGTGLTHLGAAEGTILVDSETAELLSGSATLSFLGVRLHGRPGTHTVHMELTYRAIPGTPRGCAVRRRDTAQR